MEDAVRKSSYIVSLELALALGLGLGPGGKAQEANFARSASGDNTVSIKELQVPAKAKRELERGLAQLSKEDFEGSLSHFALAIQDAPGFSRAYYHQGVAELELHREEDALRSFQTAIELADGRYPRSEFGSAFALARLGKAAEAEPIVRHGLQQRADIADGYLVLSYVLLKQNRLDEAENNALEALRFAEPNAWRGYLLLGDIHAMRGDYHAQSLDLDAYLKRFPNKRHSILVRKIRDAARELAERTQLRSSSLQP